MVVTTLEDYATAFLERAKDTDVLLNATRSTGTIHFGGITIECLIKAIIVEIKGIDEWRINQDGLNHGIKNPGHDLIEALHEIKELRQRIQQSPHMLSYLNTIQTPLINYIDMRYDCSGIDEEKFDKWKDAYYGLIRWLNTQRTQLKKTLRGGRRK